jgi:hypothetical protein
VALARLERSQDRCKPICWELDFDNAQRLRFVIDDFEGCGLETGGHADLPRWQSAGRCYPLFKIADQLLRCVSRQVVVALLASNDAVDCESAISCSAPWTRTRESFDYSAAPEVLLAGRIRVAKFPSDHEPQTRSFKPMSQTPLRTERHFRQADPLSS